jgi:hypothetical protein
MEAMEVEQLKRWMQSQLAPTRLEAIGQKAIDILKVRSSLKLQLHKLSKSVTTVERWI